MLKLALVQMRCEKGAIAENIQQIRQYVNEAVSQDCHFICFPEMSITGYINPTKNNKAILKLDGPEVAQAVELTRANKITLLAGLVEANPAGKPFITQVVARQGKLVGYYRKINIAEDELEWFAPGSEQPVFDHSATKYGLAICADIDQPEVFAASAHKGARLVFEAAAPGLYGSQETRNWQSGFDWWKEECHTKLGQYARENSLYIAVATQAGRTIDEDFPGGGYLFGPDGTCIAASADWSSGVLYAYVPFSEPNLS